MESYFIGEVRLFGANFTPRNWLACEGQLLQISQYTALFSILGTLYGGDGRTTFALPDLRGRTAIGEGRGPGLPNNSLGQRLGNDENRITTQQMASHGHSAAILGTVKMPVSLNEGSTNSPNGNFPAVSSEDFYAENPTAGTSMGTINTTGLVATVANTGNAQPVNNIMPSLGLRYIISVDGIYPSRS